MGYNSRQNPADFQKLPSYLRDKCIITFSYFKMKTKKHWCTHFIWINFTNEEFKG